MDLDSLLGAIDSGLEDRAGLHLGDFRISDAETAASMSEHRVELVQLFDAGEQLGQSALEIANALDAIVLVLGNEFLLLLGAVARQQSNVDHQFFAAREELVQRRIQGAD